MSGWEKHKKALPLFGIILILWGIFSLTRVDETKPILEPAKRRQMPELAMRSLDGTRWSLSSRRGDVVIVNLWATWCPPCREETPGLVRVANEYAGKGVSVVGVSMDEGGPEVVRRFATEFRIGYPLVVGTDDWKMVTQALPTTWLIDRNGKLAKTYVGAVREATFRKDVEALLKEAS
jgi:thiol-disulfide isomerase/thioredoxin